MAKLVWQGTGDKQYEMGVQKPTVYPISNGTYPVGYAWHGVKSITDTPSGAESNQQYAENEVYCDIRGAEKYAATIAAFTYPDEFIGCDGGVEVVDGMVIKQQERTAFGLAYVTGVGDDANGSDAGYKIHLVYGLTAAPSETTYETITDSPEAIEISFECTSLPVKMTGYKPVSHLVINSLTADPTCLAELEETLFGADGAPGVIPSLPLPDAVKTIMTPVGP